MFSQTTRLELFIVAAALLLLLFWNRAPRSGNAEVRLDAGQMAQETGSQSESSQAAVSSSSPSVPDTTASAGNVVSTPAIAAPAVPPQPKFKRIGVVDARKCSGLNYPDVLYGEVVDRWVWDGQKFILRKVCVVKESTGVTTVWDFDKHDPNVTLSEIEMPIDSH